MTDQENNDEREGIWAAGNGRTNYVHYYVTREDYENGKCLCGRKVNPHIPFPNWNTSIDFARANTCPHCLKRIAWLRFR